MEHKGTRIIETERLILRPFVPKDAEAMFCNWASDPRVTKFLTWPVHESVEVTRKVLETWVEKNDDPKNYQWAIELKEIHEPVGSISAVKIDDRKQYAAIGYCIGYAWWGRGITAEALRAVIAFFFEEVGMNCIGACHDPHNPNSGIVMRKAGMTYEGTWRAGGVNNQGICDESWHSILREEYQAAKCRENSIVQVTDPEEKSSISRKILEALPDWFGICEAREEYIRHSREQLFFAAFREECPIGFLCLKETGKETAELAVMGVLKEHHRRGTGRKLFSAAKRCAIEKGYRFIQVKTVQMGRYDIYDDTNRFYQSLGFQEFEVFPSLWGEENPCQIYVMSVR